MAITAVTNYTTVDAGAQILTGSVTFSGNYGGASSNGEVFDLSKLAYQGLGLQISPGIIPLVEFFETVPAGTLPSGYNFLYCPGTTIQTCQLAIMNGLAQITQGATYPAAILTTTVSFLLFVPSL